MPTAKAKAIQLAPVEQLRFSLYAASGQKTGLTIGDVARWCWENMVDRNTVTVFVSGVDDLGVEGICTVQFKDDTMRVHSSAKPNPRWVNHLAELVA